MLRAGPGLDILVAGRAGPGPHNSICGPGPGRVFTTAAGPGRAWASNHICGPGLGLDFRPVQDTIPHYRHLRLKTRQCAVFRYHFSLLKRHIGTLATPICPRCQATRLRSRRSATHLGRSTRLTLPRLLSHPHYPP